jgi:hypothetical protein
MNQDERVKKFLEEIKQSKATPQEKATQIIDFRRAFVDPMTGILKNDDLYELSRLVDKFHQEVAQELYKEKYGETDE